MVDRKFDTGRGALEQVPNRFLAHAYGIVHEEGVDQVEDVKHPTRYLIETPTSIVNKVVLPDLPFNWSMNPYQGCEHGCSYCYARPTHEYWGFSAGLDFERVVLVKRNAPEVLRATLAKPKWKAEPIIISGATDPYQPVERKEKITRELLKVLLECRHPASIITKNALVLRDLDILREMASLNLVSVSLSITTLNEDLRRAMEPRTSTGRGRLGAVKALANAGIPVRVGCAPIIPALNDHEIPELLKAASEAGASDAGYIMLRTNGAVEQIFRGWLQHHFPDKAGRVELLTRSAHGGRMNDSVSGRRMKGDGAYAENIARIFKVFHAKYFTGKSIGSLECGHFRRPTRNGQLELFT